MRNVLVTGGKGQLASCIRDSVKGLEGYHFIYVDVEELDITKPDQVATFFAAEKIDFCVNCAAYTAVDKAETDQEAAKSVNEDGAKNLAASCKTHRAKFIQISTDFVFDGRKSSPYTEEDATNPLGTYGATKLQGELMAASALEAHFILRTSWLYSEYGHNFLKTMLRLGSERDTLSVVYDQIGTPTYAGDLARLIVQIIKEDSVAYGTYHYSNEGVASWYDFAWAIFDISKIHVTLTPIRSEAFPTPAKRPSFSVLDKSKVKRNMRVEIPYWRDSLAMMINKVKTHKNG